MVVWEARELKKLVHKGEHNGQITDLQKNVDGTMVISSCKVIRGDQSLMGTFKSFVCLFEIFSIRLNFF